MSKVQVDAIEQQCGSTLTVGGGAGKTVVADATTVTLGRCGGTVSLASGATQSGFGRTGTVNWNTTVQTGTITVANGSGYFVNTTSGAITANLPAGSAGSICAFKDYAGTFDDNKLTISPNGSDKINGVAANYEATTESLSITLVYIDSTKGWMDVHDSTEAATGGEYIAATGGTISTVCTNYKVHVFTGPGTFCVTAGGGPLGKADYLVLAGGGSGGYKYHSGGGGAGGYRESKCSTTSGCWTASPLASSTSLNISPGPYSIVVGGGGANATCGTPGKNPGNNSSFSTITSAGGGGGGTQAGSPVVGDDGGSGGGGGSTPVSTTFGDGNVPPVSPAQGNNGGQYVNSGNYGGGGGGGAGAVGANAPSSAGGAGGPGTVSHITGSPLERGGGGGGASYNSGSGGAGGPGGGGNGTSGTSSNGTPGTVNKGGGGGGGERSPSDTGWGGGSGTVIIRYRYQ
jgi:hypothetical protein